MAPELNASADATALLADLRSGATSAHDQVAHALQRISDNEPTLNACTAVLADEARRQAQAADRLPPRLRGALHGLPIVVKDVLWVHGAPATNALEQLRDYQPATDTHAVARMRQAGAIVVAKTTNPQLCAAPCVTHSRMYGVTRNPRDPGRSPGGSSGGTAAAVAAGYVTLGLGTDAGGSIRIPAAFSGLHGYKPTTDHLPTEPGFGDFRTLAVVGPMARSARDLQRWAQIVLGIEPPPGNPKRRALWRLRFADAVIDPVVASAFEQALTVLAAAGWELEEAPDLPLGDAVADTVAGYELVQAFGHLPDDSLEPDVARTLQAARAITRSAYDDAQAARTALTSRWEKALSPTGLLLTPAAQVLAIDAEGRGPVQVGTQALDVADPRWWSMTLAANVTGQPAVTVPLPRRREGLPIGLQVSGPRGTDATVLGAASQIATAVGG